MNALVEVQPPGLSFLPTGKMVESNALFLFFPRSQRHHREGLKTRGRAADLETPWQTGAFGRKDGPWALGFGAQTADAAST